MGDVVTHHLRLLQCFLQQRRAHRRGYVPAHSPVTKETSLRIKQGLAARGKVDFGTVPAGGSVPEVAKWLVRIAGREISPPLFRLLLHIASVIPCQRAYPAGGYGAELLGFSDETVVRPGLPVPIGSRLGEIAESLLALPKRLLGLLALRDIHPSADEFNRTVGGCIKDWVRTPA